MDDKTNIFQELNDRISKKGKFLEYEHGGERFFSNLVPNPELFDFYISMDIANSLSVYHFFQRLKLELLVIDDNPELFNEILDIYKNENYFEYEIIEVCNFNKIKDLLNEIKNKINKVDLILLDLHFKEKDFTGEDILTYLKWNYPGIPIFILSKTHDIEKIKEIFEKEAEYFVSKSRIAGLPWFIYNFIDTNFGEVILNLNKKERRFLIFNIIKWKRNETYLWHGEKTYNMVEHTVHHSDSMWKLFNEFYKSIPTLFDKENILQIGLSIWLHDIGYKGYEKIIEPQLVRKKHHLITGELLNLNPELYLDREDKELIKNISLICAYHMRESPLNENCCRALNERIDKDFYYPSSFNFLNETWKGKDGEIIYLKEIDKNLVFPASILRMLDVIDKGLHRVGREIEEDVKMGTTIEDTLYYLKQLEREVEILKERIGNLRSTKRFGEFFNEIEKFLNMIRNEIKGKYKNDMRELNKKMRSPEEFSKNGEKERSGEEIYIEFYKSLKKLKSKSREINLKAEDIFSSETFEKIHILLDQVFYLLDTPLHFFTHRTFKNPTIEKYGGSFKIIYYFNEDFVNLPYNENFDFGDFSRLFQESWKIWGDIYREYIPVKNIFESKNIKFEKVEFRYRNGINKDVVLFEFPFNEKFIEVELKLKFENEYEMNEFIENMKNHIGIREKETKVVEDSFYDNDTQNCDFKKRGWFLRKREMGRKTIYEIKIEPLYWKGEYEYRIEIGPKNHNTERNENGGDIFFKLLKNNIIKDERCLEKIKKNFENSSTFFQYTQKRKNFSSNEMKDILFCSDIVEVEYKKNKLYLFEIEIQNGQPYEKEKKVREIEDKIRRFFPEIDKYIFTKTKLDWVEEQKNEKSVDSG